MQSVPDFSVPSRGLSSATDTVVQDSMRNSSQTTVKTTASLTFSPYAQDAVLTPTPEIRKPSKIVLIESTDDSGLPWPTESPSHQNDCGFSPSKCDLAGELADRQGLNSERLAASREERKESKAMRANHVGGDAVDRETTVNSKIQVLSTDRPQTAETTSSDYHGPSTLLERTRQSMALISSGPPATGAKRKSTAMRLSQFPVNQFETPRKEHLSEATLSPASNSSTPREKLFSDDVDYTSVFKTRTKIAVSPMISPDRSLLDDSFLGGRMGALDLEESDE
jgi:hypothetical protein